MPLWKRHDAFYSGARPCPGCTDENVREVMEPYHFHSEVVVIVKTSLLHKNNVKLFVTAANAIVTSCHIPSSAIHSVVLASTGTTLWLGQGHPDHRKELNEVLNSVEAKRLYEHAADDVVTERIV